MLLYLHKIIILYNYIRKKKLYINYINIYENYVIKYNVNILQN